MRLRKNSDLNDLTDTGTVHYHDNLTANNDVTLYLMILQFIRFIF